MTPEILTVASVDGAQAELIVHPATGGDFLYWLPALGVTARHYARFAETLAADGIGLARHEWRGAGSSNRRARRGVDWAYRDLLADVAGGIAALRARHPGARIWIGGHSLGAQLAALAVARDTTLSGLVIVASGTPYWRSYPLWQRPLLIAAFATVSVLSRLFGYFPGQRVGFAGREARSVMLDWARSGLSGHYRHAWPDGDLDAELRRCTLPVVAMHLRDDGYAPSSSLTELLSRLPAAAIRRHDLVPADFASARAEHFSWLKDPQPVATRVVAFIRSPN